MNKNAFFPKVGQEYKCRYYERGSAEVLAIWEKKVIYGFKETGYIGSIDEESFFDCFQDNVNAF